MTEIRELRTAKSKTFDLGNGERKLSVSIREIHYKDGSNEWRTIGHGLVSSSNPNYLYENQDNSFKVYFKENLKSNGAIRFESGGASVDITVKGLALIETDQNKQKILKIPKDSAPPTIEGRKISYSGVYPGVEFGFILLPQGIKEYVEIHDISDIPDPTTLGYNPDFTNFGLVTEYNHDADTVEDEIGVIEAGRDIGAFEFKKNGKVVFGSPNLIGFDSKTTYKKHIHKMKKRVNVSGKKITMFHGVKYSDLIAARVLPYIIDASLSQDIAAGADDGYEDSSIGWLPSTSTLLQGVDGDGKSGWSFDSAYRFPSTGLTRGDSISSAKLSLVFVDETVNTEPLTQIHGFDEDDSAQCSAIRLPNDLDSVFTVVEVNPPSASPGDVYQTPELAAIVQEIVDRPGFADNGAIHLWMENRQGGNSAVFQEWASYENSTYDPPQLDIIYTVTDWIGIDSSHFYDSCGEEATHTVEDALDGLDYYSHIVDETHYIVLDLGVTREITRYMAYTLVSNDHPQSGNIYVSDNPAAWGTAVGTFTDEWYANRGFNTELSLTPKSGRYFKVEITSTQDAEDYIAIGNPAEGFPIFDVCAVPLEEAPIVSLSGTGSIVSTTSDAALNIQRPLAGTGGIVTITSDVSLALQYLLSGTGSIVTLTSGIGLNIQRQLVGTGALVTTTSDVTLDVGVQLSGTGNIVTITSEVGLNVLRQLSGTGPMVTVTSDVTLFHLINLAGTGSMVTLTSGVLLENLVALSGTGAIVTLTSDAALNILRQLVGTGDIVTITSDILVWSNVPLSGTGSIITLTSDVLLLLEQLSGYNTTIVPQTGYEISSDTDLLTITKQTSYSITSVTQAKTISEA